MKGILINRNFAKIILLLLSLASTHGQQRGDVKIQLPKRSPVYVYHGLDQSPKEVRSLIQFDRHLPQDSSPLPAPLLQNDTPTVSTQHNPDSVSEELIHRIKERTKLALATRRAALEKVITTQFTTLEKKLASNEASLLEKITQLNQTLLSLSQTLNPSEETLPAHELENRVDTSSPRRDNALLHAYALVNSFDFNKSWSWTIHNWFEKWLQFSAFSDHWDEMNTLQDRVDTDFANDTITSSECGGPPISLKYGSFSFTPPSSSSSFSRGSCIWSLAPSNSKSILITLTEDAFLRSQASANLTLIPQTVSNWAPIQYGVNFDRSTIKLGCGSEWNCYGLGDGPQSTLKWTERVRNILQRGEHIKTLTHRDRSTAAFSESNVYLMLNFDADKGPPPSFSVSFKGRDCSSFCPDEGTGAPWDDVGHKRRLSETTMSIFYGYAAFFFGIFKFITL